MPTRIFISYARADQGTAEALVRHLRQLETAGVAEVWFDRNLELGESWEERITTEIGQADVMLLLLSPAYLASEFITREELTMIASRVRTGARAIPVVLQECGWRHDPFIGGLQAFAQGAALKAPTTITFGRQAAELVEELRRFSDTPPSTSVTREQVVDPAPLPERKSARRVDEGGVAFKGSQLQTQIYVNARTAELDEAVSSALSLPPGTILDWRSPVAATAYAEFWDRSFLTAIDQHHLWPRLKEFWPRGGPRWDALAVVHLPSGETGALLMEGKSYPEEMLGGGAKASAASREQIVRAMAWAQERLGLPADPEGWLGAHYQFANRLAHLAWLRSQGVEAWLVHALFVDDPHGATTADQWTAAISAVHEEVGVDERHLDRVGTVLLPALDRETLTRRG